MKKYFLRIFTLFSVLIYCSSASAQWSLVTNTDDGKYSLAANSSTFFGVSGGKILTESVFALLPGDSTSWRLVSNTDNGLYSLAENKVSYMGIDSGKIKTKAVFLLNPPTIASLGIDTNRLTYIDKSNSFIGRKQTFDTVNATVKYLLNGADINTGGTLSNVAYMNQSNSFIGRKQTFDTVNATAKFLLNGTDINTGGTLSNVAYLNQSNTYTGSEVVNAPSLTGSAATSIYNISQTWNTSGIPTAFKMNVTNTSSSSASLLMDLQLNGSSVFSVRRDGKVTASTVISVSDVVAGPNNGISWLGRGGLASPSASNVYVYGTSFSCFGVGGANSSFPGLSPSTNGSLKIMLADLSGYAKTIGGDFVHDDSSKGTVLKDSNGHYWRVTVNTSGVLLTTDLGTVLTGF